MHKDKKGNIIASLTEVKNKTGDIFDLVDEFGEVILTSYNKPRYKIVRIDISEVLDLEEKETKAEDKSKEVRKFAKKDKSSDVIEVIEEDDEPKKTTKPMTKPKPKKDEQALMSEEVRKSFKGFKPWNSVSRKEKGFVSKARKPLVS